MEIIDIARYLGALFLVLALLGGAGLAARKFGIPGVARGAEDKRLAVAETLMLSPRQRLVIVRRDDVEHLLLCGPDGSRVIETGFRAPPARHDGVFPGGRTPS